MPRRASKRRPPKEDEVQAAVRVIRTAVENVEKRVIDPAVSAAAAALSKLGASKGGEVVVVAFGSGVVTGAAR